MLIVPSHSVLGHLGIRTSLSDGLLATTVTMRYHHKVHLELDLLTVVCDNLIISFNRNGRRRGQEGQERQIVTYRYECFLELQSASIDTTAKS